MMKPNLLYISPITPTPDGIGLAKRAYNNLKALSNKYHIYLLIVTPGRKDCHPHPDVEQLCLKQKKIPIKPVLNFRLIIELLIKKILFFFNLKKSLHPPEWGTLSRKRIKKCWQAFSDISFSLIHVFRLYMIPVLRPYMMNFRGTVQIDMDDIESVTRNEIARLYRQNGEALNASWIERQAEFYRDQESRELGIFNRIFVCSRKDRDYIRREFPYSPVEILPNVTSIPETEDENNPLSPPYRFLFCGNFHYYPNIDGLIYFFHSLFPLIKEQAPREFRIDVVGPGIKGRLKRHLILDHRVIFHGLVQDIEPFLRKADAVIVPIRGGGGTRIKVLEGLAYGKPVVSTMKGAEGLPLRHNQHILIARNPVDFARHCLGLLRDPDQGKKIGRQGRELVMRKFSLEQINPILNQPQVQKNPQPSFHKPDEEGIDAVYTWVDGSDPDFRLALKNSLHQSGESDSTISHNRFRNNQELRYSLRSLELFTPWIRHIYLVTNGQIPSWLRLDHHRISMIDHRSIFPDWVKLPTFNSNAIELCLHHIPGLSRRFLYLNDDSFIGRDMSMHDFITPHGGIRFFQEPIPISNQINFGPPLSQSYAYTQRILEKLWGNTQKRLLPAHTPQLYDREILYNLEHLLADEFKNTLGHSFRSPDDLVLRILFFYTLIESPQQARRGHQAKTLRWGSEEYSFWMLEDNFLKTVWAFLHILRKKPGFFCINDDLTDGYSLQPTLFLFRLFLKTYFPRKSSLEK